MDVKSIFQKNTLKKKASLELSINAIVIVVLAFVMLGLGLGFVKSQFSGFEETAGSVQETVKQQILDQMREGNKKLSFPAQRLRIEKNKKEDIAVGIKNTENAVLNFAIRIYTQQVDDPNSNAGVCKPDFDISDITTVEDLEAVEVDGAAGCDDSNIGGIGYFYDTSIQSLEQTEANVFGISVNPKSTPTGTYMA